MTMTKRQLVGLLVLPLEWLLCIKVFPILFGFGTRELVLSTLFALLIGSGLVAYLFRETLKKQWHDYRRQLFFHLFTAILLTAAAQILLFLTNRLLPEDMLQLHAPSLASGLSMNFRLLAAFLPLIRVIAEEMTFRFILLNLTSSAVGKGVLLILQAILFGLTRWQSYDGNVYALIPSMVLGLFLGLIYLKTKNIWTTIIIQLMVSAMNSVLPVLLLFFIQWLS